MFVATFISLAVIGAITFGGSTALHCSTLVCPSIWNPVCASDGNTYASECHLKTAQCLNPKLSKVHPGSCKKEPEDKSYLNPGCTEQILQIECTQDEFPLCATNGVTYGNPCKFCKGLYALKEVGIELNVKNLGKCGFEFEAPMYYEAAFCSEDEKNQVCSGDEYSPFCASNGKTYRNKCLFCQAMVKDNLLSVRMEGECAENSKCTSAELQGPCADNYVPVCGSDGVTYANNCERCAEMSKRQKQGENIFIYIKYKGACPK